jgi:hypothetical protein
MTDWDTQNAIARLLAVLVSLSCALAGCGRGTAGPASLAKLLPDEVGGAELHREAFTGKVWLKSRPQQFFSPEVRANVSKFLERLRKSPSDLSVAWALLPDGVPKVVAYRVRGASADTLVASYAEALEAKICLAKILVSDKDVTVTSAGRGPARGYLYAKDDILYFAWTDYTSRHEFGELLRKLP